VGNPLDSHGSGVPDGILNISIFATRPHVGRGGKVIPGQSLLGPFSL
jgi:hypothetical protein